MRQLGEDLGRLFEVGFNIGLLSHIKQHEIPNCLGDLYVSDLGELKLPKMMDVIWRREGLIDEVDREIVANRLQLRQIPLPRWYCVDADSKG